MRIITALTIISLASAQSVVPSSNGKEPLGGGLARVTNSTTASTPNTNSTAMMSDGDRVLAPDGDLTADPVTNQNSFAVTAMSRKDCGGYDTSEQKSRLAKTASRSAAVEMGDVDEFSLHDQPSVADPPIKMARMRRKSSERGGHRSGERHRHSHESKEKHKHSKEKHKHSKEKHSSRERERTTIASTSTTTTTTTTSVRPSTTTTDTSTTRSTTTNRPPTTTTAMKTTTKKEKESSEQQQK